MTARAETSLPTPEEYQFSAVEKALQAFPDVKPSNLFVKVANPDSSQVPKDFVQGMVDAVIKFDERLAHDITIQSKTHIPHLFSRTLHTFEANHEISGLSAIEMDKARRDHVTAATEILRGIDEAVIFFPLMGAAPLMAELGLHNVQEFKGRLFAIDAPSYVGTTNTDHHSYVFPEQILDPNKIIFLTDDVVDTGHFALNLAIARMKETDAADSQTHILADRVRDTRRLGFSHPDNQIVWEDMIQVLEDQNVVLAPLIMKNKPLKAKIQERPQDSLWAYLSQKFMADGIDVDSINWITGGRGKEGVVPMFDIGVTGSSVLRHMDAANQEKYADRGMVGMSFRLGGSIPDLVRLVDPATGVDEVTKQFAQFLEVSK